VEKRKNNFFTNYTKEASVFTGAFLCFILSKLCTTFTA